MLVLDKTFGEETTLTTRAGTRQDSVDRHVSLWERELPWMDPLHEQVVARLRLLTKHLARSREAAFADDDLGRASFKVLLALRRLGSPYTAQPSELAAQLGLSRGALSARLSPLEEDGLIRRTTDPDDRRKVHVTLTRAGKRAFDRHGQHEGREEAALLDTLSVADQRRLSDLLRTLVLAVEESLG
jgi:DNA-binding MarR family transcriptional regulator